MIWLAGQENRVPPPHLGSAMAGTHQVIGDHMVAGSMAMLPDAAAGNRVA